MEHRRGPEARSVKDESLKSLPWRKDPIILERLAKVQRLWLMNYSCRQIEQAIGIDHSTAAKDIKRVQTLIRENVTEDLIKDRAESIAKYKETQNMAYLTFLQTPNNSMNKSRYLDTVKACEDSIVKVKGIAVEKHEVTGEIGIRRYVGVDPAEV